MSLKSFHIIFIVIATLLCVAVAVWALYFNSNAADIGVRVIGWLCAVVAAVLPVYGTFFYRKNLSGNN